MASSQKMEQKSKITIPFSSLDHISLNVNKSNHVSSETESQTTNREENQTQKMERTSRIKETPIRLGPLLFDLSAFIFLAVLFVVVPEVGIQPYRRGFFCDDESIRYPYKPNTVSPVGLAFINIGMIVVTISIVEIFRIIKFSGIDCSSYKFRGRDCNKFLVRFCTYSAYCIFGLLLNLVLCQVTKISIGRLRPHFIDVCKPNISKTCENTYEYITDYYCTGSSEANIRQARLSFFSGHASLTTSVAIYCVIYLQARLPRRIYGVSPLPIFQLILMGGAMLVGYSRISDNMHHWSDVLVGFGVGIATGYFAAVHLARLLERQNIKFSNAECSPLIDSEIPPATEAATARGTFSPQSPPPNIHRTIVPVESQAPAASDLPLSMV